MSSTLAITIIPPFFIRLGNRHTIWISLSNGDLRQQYIEALSQAHIRLIEEPDEIIWAFAKNGTYSPKEGYIRLMDPHKPQSIDPNWRSFWKLKAAPRTCLLLWNILFYKVPTSANLMKRTFHGPFRCHLCQLDEENTEHLFLNCPSTKEFSNCITAHYPSLNPWHGKNIHEAWNSWCQAYKGKIQEYASPSLLGHLDC